MPFTTHRRLRNWTGVQRLRRVVVTGLGLVSPLACGVEATWQGLLRGRSAVDRITRFDASQFATTYAAEIPQSGEHAFDADQWMERRDQRKVDEFIVYAIAAADQAISDAALSETASVPAERIGVMIGSGIGGLTSIAKSAVLLKERGPRRISPFFIPGALINLASGQVSIRHGFKGPNHAVATACATGVHAIGDAARIIGADCADIMVAGGSESPISELGIAGFNACRALSTKWNHDPQRASRPFDRDRDGFVMGEGAGVIVLEELNHARARGARIYAEIIGYGLSGDASHITAPAPDGSGGYRCMKSALAQAGPKAEELDYINAHGTSTMADTIELLAIGRLVGEAVERVSVSSTKSSIGHLLGAAGAVEAVFCVLAIRDQVVPPTINLERPDDDGRFDLVPGRAKQRQVRVAMSNSFGFGGTNASIVFAGV